MFATNDAVLAYLRSYRAEGTLGVGGPWLCSTERTPGFTRRSFGAPGRHRRQHPAAGSAVREMAYGSFEKAT